MSLTEKVAKFLDPQMALAILDFSLEQNKTLRLELLSQTLLSGKYLSAGGDSAKAKEMESKAASATDSESLFLQGEYKKALDAGSDNTWLLFACHALLGENDKAAALLPQIDTQVENSADEGSSTQSKLDQLYKRAWYVHWACYCLLLSKNGCEKLCELLQQSQCMTTIQSACPWILRYLAIATVVTAGRHSGQSRRVKELVKVISQESYEYTDPILDFVLALCANYSDLKTLGSKLEATEPLIKGDYLVQNLSSSFKTAATALIVDSYAKAHSQLSIKKVSSALNISTERVEELLHKESIQGDIYSVLHRKYSLRSQLSDRANAINERGKAALEQGKAKEVTI